MEAVTEQFMFISLFNHITLCGCKNEKETRENNPFNSIHSSQYTEKHFVNFHSTFTFSNLFMHGISCKISKAKETNVKTLQNKVKM